MSVAPVELILKDYEELRAKRSKLNELIKQYKIYTKKTLGMGEVFDKSVIDYEIYATLGFQSYLWNDSKPPTYTHNNPDIAEKEEVKAYYEAIAPIVSRQLLNNTDTGFPEMFTSLVRDWRNLGTGFAIVTTAPNLPFFTYSIDVENCYIGTDELGRVDRFFYLTGLHNAKNLHLDEEQEILTLFYKEEGNWRSIVIDREKEQITNSKEFGAQPIFVARRNLRSGELYGLGNGLIGLDEIRDLNVLKQMIMKTVENNTLPPVAQREGVTFNNQYLDLSAGAHNIVSTTDGFGAGSSLPITPLVPFKSIQDQLALYELVSSSLKDSYQFDRLIDLNTTGVMTATESSYRENMRNTLFSSDCRLFYMNVLQPMHKTILYLAKKKGLLGSTSQMKNEFNIETSLVIPDVIQDDNTFLDVTITYHAPATVGDYQSKMQNLTQSVQFIAMVQDLVAKNPALAKYLDVDEITESFAKYSNTEEILKTLSAQEISSSYSLGQALSSISI